MVASGGPRRSLTFAGAVLLPESHSGSASLGPATAATRPSSSPRQTPSSSAPAATGISRYQPPVARLIPAASASRTVPATSAAGTPTPVASSRPATPRTSVPAMPQAESGTAAIARALFAALNDARHQAGLPALAWSGRLQHSAAGHNQAMAHSDQLASRVGDEPALGVRQANQGVLGKYAAEVVGYTQTLSSAGALAVQQSMLAEQPPDDSQRQVLLSSAVNAVGIDVLLDPAHGRLWITEDFAQLR